MPRFSSCEKLIIEIDSAQKELEFPSDFNGMEYQIMEANRCLKEGLSESHIMPFAESLETMRIVDVVMKQNK